MKLQRTELIQALEQVKGAVAAKGFVPILQHVLVSAGSVLAFDSEVGIKAKLSSAIETPFNVRFNTFLDLLRQLEAEDITLEVTDKAIKIACGRHKSTMAQIVEDFPKPKVNVAPGDWRDIPAGFKEAVERAVLAISDDENNRALSAMLIAGDKVYGADGKQLVRCTVPGLSVAPFLIPRKAVGEIIRLGNPKRVAVAESMAVFDYVTLTLLVRLREDKTYPKAQFDDLFTNRTASAPLPDGLSTALGRLGILAGDDLKAITLQPTPMGLELSVAGERNSGTELIDLNGVSFGKKAINSVQALPLLQYSENWDPGTDPRQLFYFTGETAGFEALMAPVLL